MEKLKRPADRTADDAARSAAGVDLPAAARAIEAFLTALGHAPHSDEQLGNTGRLVANAFNHELLRGYAMDPARILAESVAAKGGDLIVVRNIDVTCVCPHHLMPATGVLHIGYAPTSRVVGFGALARLAECFSRRLTLQETLCENIADALVTHLGARGGCCIADLTPTCLTARGEESSHARVVCSASSGVLRDSQAMRAEFFALAGAARDREQSR